MRGFTQPSTLYGLVPLPPRVDCDAGAVLGRAVVARDVQAKSLKADLEVLALRLPERPSEPRRESVGPGSIPERTTEARQARILVLPRFR